MEGGCRTKRSPRLVCKPSSHPEPLILRVTALLLLVTLSFCAVTSGLRCYHWLSIFIKQRRKASRISIFAKHIVYACFCVNPDFNNIHFALAINLLKTVHNASSNFSLSDAVSLSMESIVLSLLYYILMFLSIRDQLEFLHFLATPQSPGDQGKVTNCKNLFSSQGGCAILIIQGYYPGEICTEKR